MAGERGAEIESGPEEYGYMPGYYAVFFYDPDGIKLEIVHIPGTCCLKGDHEMEGPTEHMPPPPSSPPPGYGGAGYWLAGRRPHADSRQSRNGSSGSPSRFCSRSSGPRATGPAGSSS